MLCGIYFLAVEQQQQKQSKKEEKYRSEIDRVRAMALDKPGRHKNCPVHIHNSPDLIAYLLGMATKLKNTTKQCCCLLKEIHDIGQRPAFILHFLSKEACEKNPQLAKCEIALMGILLNFVYASCELGKKVEEAYERMSWEMFGQPLSQEIIDRLAQTYVSEINSNAVTRFSQQVAHLNETGTYKKEVNENLDTCNFVFCFCDDICDLTHHLSVCYYDPTTSILINREFNLCLSNPADVEKKRSNIVVVQDPTSIEKKKIEKKLSYTPYWCTFMQTLSSEYIENYIKNSGENVPLSYMGINLNFGEKPSEANSEEELKVPKLLEEIKERRLPEEIKDPKNKLPEEEKLYNKKITQILDKKTQIRPVPDNLFKTLCESLIEWAEKFRDKKERQRITKQRKKKCKEIEKSTVQVLGGALEQAGIHEQLKFPESLSKELFEQSDNPMNLNLFFMKPSGELNIVEFILSHSLALELDRLGKDGFKIGSFVFFEIMLRATRCCEINKEVVYDVNMEKEKGPDEIKAEYQEEVLSVCKRVREEAFSDALSLFIEAHNLSFKLLSNIEIEKKYETTKSVIGFLNIASLSNLTDNIFKIKIWKENKEQEYSYELVKRKESYPLGFNLCVEISDERIIRETKDIIKSFEERLNKKQKEQKKEEKKEGKKEQKKKGKKEQKKEGKKEQKKEGKK